MTGWRTRSRSRRKLSEFDAIHVQAEACLVTAEGVLGNLAQSQSKPVDHDPHWVGTETGFWGLTSSLTQPWLQKELGKNLSIFASTVGSWSSANTHTVGISLSRDRKSNVVKTNNKDPPLNCFIFCYLLCSQNMTQTVPESPHNISRLQKAGEFPATNWNWKLELFPKPPSVLVLSTLGLMKSQLLDLPHPSLRMTENVSDSW